MSPRIGRSIPAQLQRAIRAYLPFQDDPAGSNGGLWWWVILDGPYRYPLARHVVTRGHFIPDTPSGSKRTWFPMGQVSAFRASWPRR